MSDRPEPVRADDDLPFSEVLDAWRADDRTIPRDQWDIARRAGWLGPGNRWKKPLAPHPEPDQADLAIQNVVEYEFEKSGFDIEGKTWILDRPDSASTFIAFRLYCDGTLLPGHPMPWDQRGALAIVRVSEMDQGADEQQFSCGIQVWNIWKDRLTDHGWSVVDFDEESAADLDEEGRRRAKYEWYCTDATAENMYQAVRRALIDIFGAGADGLPMIGPFDVGWQPFANTPTPETRADDETPDPWADSTGSTATGTRASTEAPDPPDASTDTAPTDTETPDPSADSTGSTATDDETPDPSADSTGSTATDDETPDPSADSTGSTATGTRASTEAPDPPDASTDTAATEAGDEPAPAENEPVDAFEQARERAEYWDALYELDLPPDEDGIDDGTPDDEITDEITGEEVADDEIAEVMEHDEVPLASTPDRAFDMAIGDMVDGDVYIHGEKLMIVTERGHMREIWVPAEFRFDGEVNHSGIEDWLGLADGERPADAPAGWAFMGHVTDDAFRTPISQAAVEPTRRRRGRAKFIIGGVAATAALSAGVSDCWGWNTGDDQTDSLIEMQEDAAEREREAAAEDAQQRALDCLLGGPLNVESGECTSGGEPVDAATLCVGYDADVTVSGDCDFADTDDPGTGASLCSDNGGSWNPSTSVCDFGAADVSAGTVCGPGLAFDESIGECTRVDTSDDACREAGGEWLSDTGICSYTPTGYHAALGMRPPAPARSDPIGGLSGSDLREWLVNRAAAIVAYSAWVTDVDELVYGQQYGNTSYPCGADTPDYRVVCPIGAADTGPGEFVVVSMELEAAADPDGGWLTYGLAFDDPALDNYRGRPPFELDLFNDTEVWHRYEIDPGGERRVYADGFRDGSPNFPRLSSVRVIDFGDVIVWVVPRDELPEGELRYRLTAFRSAGGPLAAPDPATDGGDVSGLDVDTLDVVPDEVVVAELGPDVPPDTEGVPLDPPVGDDPDLVLTELLVDDLRTRWNAAFDVGTPEAVAAVFHPAATLPSADGCIAFVERIFPGAIEIRLTLVSGPTPFEGFVDYRADADVDYPTGTTQFQVQLSVGPGGRLQPIFGCDA